MAEQAVESKVLVGKGRQGDFVHETQGVAKEEGFGHISKLWYPKTQPLSAGIDAIYDERRQREDITATMQDMQVVQQDDGSLGVQYRKDGRVFVPTDNGWQQLAKWAFVPQGFLNAYMSNPIVNGKEAFERDNADRAILMEVFRNGARRREEKEFLFRTYTDGTLRACLTGKYAIIDNIWYLEVLQDLFKVLGHEPRLSHWRGNADTIFGNILIPDTVREEKDSDYGGMFSVGNCEIGRRRLEQYPSVFRAICMNGCIWDQEKGEVISKVHRGEINLQELRDAIVLNIHEQIPLLNAGVEKFLATQARTLPKNVSVAQAVAELAKSERFSFGLKGQAVEVLKQFDKFEKGDRNLFGLINSVTRAGQLYDNDSWLRFDEVGGKLMTWDNNSWDRFTNRAAQLTVADVNKVFGLETETVAA
jgi:hypothetical protein